MRLELAVVSAALALAACKKEPPPPAAAVAAPAAETTRVNSIRGRVVEKIDASQYTYLRLQTATGEVWAAVPQSDAKVGDDVSVANPLWMENFKSATLKRKWERIAFGPLGEPEDTKLPTGHPATGDESQLPAGHPSIAAASPVGDVKVAKAPGAKGRTIADIYAGRKQLGNSSVSVRGTVVKATNGVLGKNWLHLRDGTGQGATADLAVTSTDTAKVGDTVVVSGVVHLDRDLGSGYQYDVLVEDAKIVRE